MQEINQSKMVSILSKSGIFGAILIIVLYFGQIFINQNQQISKQLLEIKLEITRIKLKMVTIENVDEKIQKAIEIHEKLYHSNNK